MYLTNVSRPASLFCFTISVRYIKLPLYAQDVHMYIYHLSAYVDLHIYLKPTHAKRVRKHETRKLHSENNTELTSLHVNMTAPSLNAKLLQRENIFHLQKKNTCPCDPSIGFFHSVGCCLWFWLRVGNLEENGTYAIAMPSGHWQRPSSNINKQVWSET